MATKRKATVKKRPKMDAEDRADMKRTGKMPSAAEERREAKAAKKKPAKKAAKKGR